METLKSIAVVLIACGSVSAQWLHYPTPGIPRTTAGKPNLSAPAPKTAAGKPDLSGIWVPADGKYLPNLAVDGIDVPFQPWALALYKERQANHGMGRPSERCLTHGVTDFDALATPRKIIQTPQMIAILFESYNHYRQIFLDGRPLPERIQPAYMGYSVGKWDGDTLVVDTTGFDERGWLDDGGHPQTEALHVTERYRRTNFGHITLQITIDDAKAYTKPWTVNLSGFNLLADEELMESICENEKDVVHMVGK
ncbi:MAG: hypothetical protein C5B51_13910 [Terriglobia bacterium]|nr:MAG: hypothetical protein C5B51_13910 [Terriglobia bacterium]